MHEKMLNLSRWPEGQSPEVTGGDFNNRLRLAVRLCSLSGWSGPLTYIDAAAALGFIPAAIRHCERSAPTTDAVQER